jgi:DNA mismatch repair protein MutL
MDKFPVAVLFINISFDQVDVNVHPTKHEIRFLEQKTVHQTVEEAVARALRFADKNKWTPTFYKEKQPAIPHRVEEAVTGFNRMETGISKFKEKIDEPDEQSSLWGKKSFGDLRLIGQFHNSYILCEYGDGLVLIDQHAAHERVLFEQLKNRSLDSRNSAQRLLVPEPLDFGYREAEILRNLIPDLHSLGLEVEPFGGNTFVIKSVPAMLADRDVKPLLMEIVEKMAQIGFAPGLERAIDQCLILIACHGAVRANQQLTDEQIRALLDQLDGCDTPSNCPHGRPTWVRWSLRELEKSFKRIV